MPGYLQLDYFDAGMYEGKQNLHFTFPSRDPVFAGHYPYYPVVPASLIVGLCCDLIQDLYSVDVLSDMCWRVIQARFSRGIYPDETALVTIEASDTHFLFQISVDSQEVANLKFQISEDGNRPVETSTNLCQMVPAAQILPQRYPLLAIDIAGSCQEASTGIARKMVSFGDYCFRDFQPDGPAANSPRYPIGGVIEGIEQAAAVLLAKHWDFADLDRVTLVAGLHDITFNGFASPGEAIDFVTRTETITDRLAILSGQASVEERPLVSIGKIYVVRLEKEQ